MGTIVVATDGSETGRRAVSEGIELARATGDSIVLVTAWQDPPTDVALPFEALVPPPAGEVERAWAERTLEEARAEVERAGVPVETDARRGSAAHEICEAARERGARLIVVGSHGWGLLEGVLFGSVSRGVLAHAPCPVVIVPPHGKEEAKEPDR